MEDGVLHTDAAKDNCDMNANSTGKGFSEKGFGGHEVNHDNLVEDNPHSGPEGECENSCTATAPASPSPDFTLNPSSDINVGCADLKISDSTDEGTLVTVPEAHINGLCFGNKNVDITTDIMELILSYCDLSSLPHLRVVCVAWNELVEVPYFWNRVMLKRNMLHEWAPIYEHVGNRKDAWKVFYSMIKNNFLNSNLVKNPSGEDGFTNWTHMSGEVGGWTIDAAEGLQVLGIPRFNLSTVSVSEFCFGTNNFSCSKEQDVDLWEAGLTQGVMKAIVPFAITWTEYVATPEGCDGIYEADCSLLDSSLGPISPYSPYQYRVRQRIPGGTSWRPFQKRFIVNHKNEHEVCDELRYVHIFHGGMECGSTPGHYGPRMAGCSVVISLIKPSERF